MLIENLVRDVTGFQTSTIPAIRNAGRRGIGRERATRRPAHELARRSQRLQKTPRLQSRLQWRSGRLGRITGCHLTSAKIRSTHNLAFEIQRE